MDDVQVNKKLTMITFERSARVLPVAAAYCKTVATANFVLKARSQGLSQDLPSIDDSEGLTAQR